MQKSTGFIANIDIGKEYDARYAADEVHYETFAGLAAFLAGICRCTGTIASSNCIIWPPAG